MFYTNEDCTSEATDGEELPMTTMISHVQLSTSPSGKDKNQLQTNKHPGETPELHDHSPISSCSDEEKNERRPLRHPVHLDHEVEFDSPAKLVQGEPCSTDTAIECTPSSKNVQAAFKYPLLSLKLHGLTWKSNENAKCDWCTGYCILVSMMFFIFGVLQIVKFDGDITLGPVFMFHIAVVLSWVQSFIGHASFVFGTRKHLRKLLEMWENYRQYHGGIAYKQLYKVASLLTIGFNAYLLCLFGTGILVCTFVKPDLASYMVKPFLNYGGKDTSLVLWGIGSTITFFLLWVWLEPYLFVATLVHLLKREFVQASKDFSKTVHDFDLSSSNGGDRHIDIEDHRKRHLMLCKITNKVDDMIYGFLIFTYAIDIPVLCAMIFVIFHAENYPNLDWASLSFGLLWFCYVSCHLAALTLNGAFLTSAAVSPRDAIHDVDVRYLHRQQGLSLQMFMNKLSFDHVGLTVWKLITIDRRLLITIFALVICYALLLFKFAIALGRRNAIIANNAASSLALLSNITSDGTT